MVTAMLPAGYTDYNMLCVKNLIVSSFSGDILMRYFSASMDTMTNLAGLDNGRVAPLQRAVASL